VNGRRELIASYYTLSGSPVGEPPRFPFAARVEAAARAGFAGMGLLSDDYLALQAAGVSDAALRRVLADHRMRVLEIEFHFDWTAEGSRGASARTREAALHAMADAFSPHHLNVGDLNPPGEGPSIGVVADRFGAVCDRAAEHGVRVALEFLPWTAIPDLATALEIVERAGRPNGGVLVDAWHFFRGNPDAARLRSTRRDQITAIQLDDADAEPVGPSFEDTMLRRRLPGEGAFDLVGLVRTFDAIGVDVPYSVEILSSEHQRLSVREAARRAFASTSAMLRRADPGP
jgi:sugar phosphate isomerase/epimerase